MMLLLSIVMVGYISWGLFNYTSVRGGSPWFWACLAAVGYVAAELCVCYALQAKPSEYFLTYFPSLGILWLGLVGLMVRLRFRRRAINPIA
jgi:hypothetical protein